MKQYCCFNSAQVKKYSERTGVTPSTYFRGWQTNGESEQQFYTHLLSEQINNLRKKIFTDWFVWAVDKFC